MRSAYPPMGERLTEAIQAGEDKRLNLHKIDFR